MPIDPHSNLPPGTTLRDVSGPDDSMCDHCEENKSIACVNVDGDYMSLCDMCLERVEYCRECETRHFDGQDGCPVARTQKGQ